MLDALRRYLTVAQLPRAELSAADLVVLAAWTAVCALLVVWRLDMYAHNVFGVDLYYYSYTIHHTSFFDRLLPAALTYQPPLSAPAPSDFYQGVHGSNSSLAEYFAPMLLVLAAFAKFLPAPQMLLVLGVACHYVTVILIYALARKALPTQFLPIALAAAYAVNPALLASVIEQNGGWYLDTLAPPFILATVTALLARRWRTYALFVFLLLCIKPNLSVGVLLLGLWLSLCGPRFRIAAIGTVAAGLLAFAVGVSFPMLVGANYAHVSKITPFLTALLTSPSTIFASLDGPTIRKASLLIGIPFSPALLFPPAVAIVMPDILINTFVGRTFAHNWLGPYAVLSAGGIVGLHLLLRRWPTGVAMAQRADRMVVVGPLVLLLAAVSLTYSHRFHYGQHIAAAPDPATVPYEEALAMAQLVPDDKWLSTTIELGRVFYDHLNWAIVDNPNADYVLLLVEPPFNNRARQLRLIDAMNARIALGQARLIEERGPLKLYARVP